ncbi:MAG: hypothetical protein OXE59_12660, partial [Bacteroidetes bacterium]|nr:hypothetical protein [Bacteroidota bacterium]
TLYLPAAKWKFQQDLKQPMQTPPIAINSKDGFHLISLLDYSSSRRSWGYISLFLGTNSLAEG